MPLQTVPETLRGLLADVFDISPEQVTADLAAGSIERWDSFGHLQAVLAIEAEYGIQFDPQKVPNLTTVSLLCQEMQAKGVNFQ